ncbi:DNA glycosylase AlkZ-like family protein [Corynebacterium atypicum]|uniref:DNA glycosylase AlkZ-like family protein n=1 Tax=Corynebacterium atypicum TaxID=191610 RepID=UPI000A026767|nr:crosslink repair DNA glycosylase YcaQ family protein [Corynebacterium atypicum]
MERNREIRARRLIAQHLAQSAARPAASGPVEVLHEMLALRAQRFWPAVRALAARAECSEDDVIACVRRGEIVRTRTGWDTPIMVAAEDARWLARTLTSAPARLAAVQRAHVLGLQPEEISRARKTIHAELAGRPFTQPLTGFEAFAIFAEIGIDPDGGRGVHLLRILASEGEVVCGATRQQATFAHVNSLPGNAVDLRGDAALAELAGRFIASRGPAGPADLAQWAGLSAAVAEHAVSCARGLTGFDEDLSMASWQCEVTCGEIKRALRRTMVLDSVDDYLASYGDTSLVLSPGGHAEGWQGNDDFGQRVIAHGEVVNAAA